MLFELGAGLILWGILLQLGTPLVLMLSVTAILASYVLTINADPQVSAPAWRLLFVPGNVGIIGTGWPILPWVAISGFGLAFGRLLLDDETRAMRLTLTFGIALILLFVCLRVIGLGDPHPPVGTGWIDFLRVTKYPPSPAFIALTIGGNLLLLCGFHRTIVVGIKVEPFLTFGQAALFFYIAHTWMYMFVGLAFPRGVGFFWIYPIWLLGLVALYPLCRRYSDFKWGKPVESLWRMA